MSLEVFTDEHFMRQAIIEAEIAYEKGEIPVGAVIVSKNKIIARGHNLTEQLNDVTAHAEMMAITAAANHLGGKYLNGCTLFVTLEPCAMCAGATFWSHLGRLVFGASDQKRGYRANNPNMLHPKTTIHHGVLAAEAEGLLKSFFQARRKKS